ncbi:MAG TPA: hypothetical protein VJ875_06865 [Pyrinomonadaceae bacterium]|nr:hypothetical protein [Pyrinomonadaceae bacterium]
MKRPVIYTALALVLMSLSLLSETSAHRQAIPESLLEKRITLHIKQGTFLYALSTLCVDYRIPIGFEPALGHKAQYHLNIELENTTLENVLNELVGQETGYRWELRDGAINIIPITSRDDFVEKLLNTPISQFDQPKKLGKFQIRDAIVELPEVVALLKANGITASHYGYAYTPTLRTERIDLSISGTDVRGVLNKVIRETEHNMWIVSRSGKNLSSLDLSF